MSLSEVDTVFGGILAIVETTDSISCTPTSFLRFEGGRRF
jgi:hypothetical protein